MTVDEAKERILVSRRTLARMAQALKTHEVSTFNNGFVEAEIAALEAIGGKYPDTIDHIVPLVARWVDLQQRPTPKLQWPM